MKFLVLFFVSISSLCFSQNKIKTGIWRGTLLLNPEKQLELPFNFEIKNNKGKITLVIHNAQERISIEEVSLIKDSLIFKMPIFDTEFRTQLTGDSIIKGLWINHTKKENKSIAFSGRFGNKNRFIVPVEKPTNFYDGRWECTFSPETKDSSKAIGIFKHVAN